ncbi:uncharacterized protein METZ01_LOCUS268671, partial [marine metagenome]
MANQILIKRSTNTTIPNSNISGGSLTAGELGYSYSSGDGSGDEQGLGKLFIGHADGLGGTRAAAIIGGSYFTNLLDHGAGTLTASSAIITNAQNHVDAIKITGLYLGASGSAVQVTSSAAELNKLDGVTSSTAELNTLTGITSSTAELNKLDGVAATTTQLDYVVNTPGALTANKAMIVDGNSSMNVIKTSQFYLGTSGGVQVTASATELNLLDGITAIDTDLSTTAGTHTTLVSALAAKTYIDNTRSGLEVKDSVVVATTANITLSGTQTIDGIAVTAGQRVLVKDQTTASQNGIYVVSASAWSRSTDADTADELNSGCFFFV